MIMPKPTLFAAAMTLALLLSGCSKQTDNDPAATDARATTDDRVPVSVVPESATPGGDGSAEAPTASAEMERARRDALDSTADRSATPSSDVSEAEALAQCERLDAAQRDECTLRVRQGFARDEGSDASDAGNRAADPA